MTILRLKQKLVSAVIEQRSRKETARLQAEVEQYIIKHDIEATIPEEEYERFFNDVMTFIACERDTFDNEEDLIVTAVFQTLEKRRQFNDHFSQESKWDM